MNLPGLSLPNAAGGQPNPLLNIPQQGDHLVYETLDITFKVDEELKNWLEIHNWIRYVGKRDFDEYSVLKAIPHYTQEGLVSDISLHILDSNKLPVYEVVYQNAWPITMTNLVFNTMEPDIQYLTVSASFQYTAYDLKPVV